MSAILTPDEFYKLITDFSYAPYGDMAGKIMEAYKAACHYATWTQIDPDYNQWNCSACTCSWIFEDDTPGEDFHFCPQCGAQIEAFIRDVE